MRALDLASQMRNVDRHHLLTIATLQLHGFHQPIRSLECGVSTPLFFFCFFSFFLFYRSGHKRKKERKKAVSSHRTPKKSMSPFRSSITQIDTGEKRVDVSPGWLRQKSDCSPGSVRLN